MPNYFLFNKNQNRCAFDFDKLLLLSIGEVEQFCDDFIDQTLNTTTGNPMLFHLVLNRLLNASYINKA